MKPCPSWCGPRMAKKRSPIRTVRLSIEIPETIAVLEPARSSPPVLDSTCPAPMFAMIKSVMMASTGRRPKYLRSCTVRLSM